MALTDGEQRLLAQIAEDLAQQDPRLARKLGSCRTPSARLSAGHRKPMPSQSRKRCRLRTVLICVFMVANLLTALAAVLVGQYVLFALAVLLASIAVLGVLIAQFQRPPG